MLTTIHPFVKFVLPILMVVFAACSDNSRNNDIAASLPGSVSFTNGRIQLDTTIILSNRNLPGLVEHLKYTHLHSKSTTDKIPTFIKSFLDSLDTDFSIAHVGGKWEAGCIVDLSAPLPRRQLIYLGLDKNITLLSYYKGGMGRSQRVLIFKHDNTRITDFWSGYLHNDVKSKAGILKQLDGIINTIGGDAGSDVSI